MPPNVPPTAHELVRALALATAKTRIDELVAFLPLDVLPEAIRCLEGLVAVLAEGEA